VNGGVPSVSIVMPVLDEAARIERTLAPLQAWRRAGTELVVVDGGSADRTRELAAPLCDRLITAPRGRALQMNAGAAASRGHLLLFLHADTSLPAGARALLEDCARGSETWGRFDVRLDGRHRLLPVIAALMNWRSRITAVATGDQAIFVTRALFERCGGFPPLPLMEDIALSKRLRRVRRPRCPRVRATTSGRRWEQGGVLRTVLLMWGLRFAYFLGVDAQRLARWYRQVR